ncbi:hypothetical protein Ocin01_08024 [Orchesella cincta]|uniref:RETREG1-3/ARL6IP-like N-terminal reticulon-homology domain-containing protein n=1 Tax=Orchesella cincta TaxID=48709 RepID=A0A1D2N0Q7_ORCCI|nr:hypothetical protein Ocin01_08024 [Orchesella cincta]
MNANLVSILSWTRPYKSGVALLSVNVIFWFLMHQRPVCVLTLGGLCFYLRYLWKHRIRPEVLVDPPDCEDWTTLSSYDFEQKYISLSKNVWNRWVNLRTENHLMWTTVTCTMWILLGKLGSQVDFVTFLFLISNAAFLLIPLLKICPSFELASLSEEGDGVIKEEDLIPEVPKQSSKTSKSSITGWTDSSSEASTPGTPPGPHPVRIEESPPRRRMSPTLTTALTEGMLSRSISAAAASFVTSGISKASVMSASAAVISSLAPQFTQSLSTTVSETLAVASPPLQRNSSGPDSLTPGITHMPDHEVVDSDPEDEFLFDAKHFDKSSSSSSTSNSFEIINNI